MITIRLRVFRQLHGKLPDRVRVVVKQRDALFIPFTHKITSITLPYDDWRRVEESLCCNEQVVRVSLQLEQLLRRDERQLLALQLYCLRGRTVQHKALGRFTRVMQQMQDGELWLSLHYPGCRPQEYRHPLRCEHFVKTHHCTECMARMSRDEYTDYCAKASEYRQQRDKNRRERIATALEELKAEQSPDEGCRKVSFDLPDNDSLKSEQQDNDSLQSVQQPDNDSLQSVQQGDDSLQTVQQDDDSLQSVQQNDNDSLQSVQQNDNDSLQSVQQNDNDSLQNLILRVLFRSILTLGVGVMLLLLLYDWW